LNEMNGYIETALIGVCLMLYAGIGLLTAYSADVALNAGHNTLYGLLVAIVILMVGVPVVLFIREINR